MQNTENKEQVMMDDQYCDQKETTQNAKNMPRYPATHITPHKDQPVESDLQELSEQRILGTKKVTS